MSECRRATLHGTVVATARGALLLRGPSGAGKSDLALRLIHADYAGLDRAVLVADDRVIVTRSAAPGPEPDGSIVFASAPPELWGRLEVRGLGILTMPALHSARLRLVIDLVPRDAVPRYPALDDPAAGLAMIVGAALPLVALCAWDQSAALKALLALQRATALAEWPAKAHFP